ncbi:hypothetical protein WL93_05330 [Burkholderia diffusa]|nr:hypothetical protein WJ39_19685 [Burkholderia diffusa]KWF34926.1 hypothetical protein WL86_24100 [Burkholderia diffusa]KWF97890.1 hypothetical protein WL93_05330 [Burkholderia diffusa]
MHGDTGCTSTRPSSADTKQEIAVSRNAIQRTGVFPALSNRFVPGAPIAFDAARRAERNGANR